MFFFFLPSLLYILFLLNIYSSFFCILGGWNVIKVHALRAIQSFLFSFHLLSGTTMGERGWENYKFVRPSHDKSPFHVGQTFLFSTLHSALALFIFCCTWSTILDKWIVGRGWKNQGKSKNAKIVRNIGGRRKLFFVNVKCT